MEINVGGRKPAGKRGLVGKTVDGWTDKAATTLVDNWGFFIVLYVASMGAIWWHNDSSRLLDRLTSPPSLRQAMLIGAVEAYGCYAWAVRKRPRNPVTRLNRRVVAWVKAFVRRARSTPLRSVTMAGALNVVRHTAAEAHTESRAECRKRGTIAELRELPDTGSGHARALELLQGWWNAGCADNLSEHAREHGRPQKVQLVQVKAASVKLVVEQLPQSDTPGLLRAHKAGIEMHARKRLEVYEAAGQPPNVLVWKFITGQVDRPGPVPLRTGGSVADGVRIGIDAESGEWITMPIVGEFGLIAAGPNTGKTTAVRTIVEQLLTYDDCHVMVIDQTVGVPTLRDRVHCYIGDLDEAVKALGRLQSNIPMSCSLPGSHGDPIATLGIRRQYRDALGLLEITPSLAMRHLVVIADEFPDLLANCPKDMRNALTEAWVNFVRVVRKEGVSVFFTTQKTVNEAIPTGIMSACRIKLVMHMKQADGRLALDSYYRDGWLDPSTLTPKTGEAILVLPGDTEARRIYVAPPPVDQPSPARPPIDPTPRPPVGGGVGGVWPHPVGPPVGGGESGGVGGVWPQPKPQDREPAAEEPTAQGPRTRDLVADVFRWSDEDQTLTGVGKAVGRDRATVRPHVLALVKCGLVEMVGPDGPYRWVGPRPAEHEDAAA